MKILNNYMQLNDKQKEAVEFVKGNLLLELVKLLLSLIDM